MLTCIYNITSIQGLSINSAQSPCKIWRTIYVEFDGRNLRMLVAAIGKIVLYKLHYYLYTYIITNTR